MWLDLWRDKVRNIDALKREPELEGEARWPKPPRAAEGSCPCDMLDVIAEWLESPRLCPAGWEIIDILLSKLRNPDRLGLVSGEVFGSTGAGSGLSNRSSAPTTSKYAGASPRGSAVSLCRELVSCKPVSTSRVPSSTVDAKLCNERSPSVPSLRVSSLWSNGIS